MKCRQREATTNKRRNVDTKSLQQNIHHQPQSQSTVYSPDIVNLSVVQVQSTAKVIGKHQVWTPRQLMAVGQARGNIFLQVVLISYQYKLFVHTVQRRRRNTIQLGELELPCLLNDDVVFGRATRKWINSTCQNELQEMKSQEQNTTTINGCKRHYKLAKS